MDIDKRILAGAVLLLLLFFAGGMKYEAIRAGQAKDAQKLVEQPREGDRNNDGKDAGDKNIIKVYVCGEVKNPGVYSLREGDRWYQAIEMAGGPLEQADVKHLQMARTLVDGENVYVPVQGETPSASGGQDTAAPAFDAQAAGGKININTASAGEMDQKLDGIGPTLAGRIVEYRTANGPFRTLEDLKNVSGIGDKKFAAVKDQICVN